MDNKNSTLRDIIIGAVIAIVSSVIIQFSTSQYNLYQERKSLESAFHGEISSILYIVRARNLPLLVNDAINNTNKKGRAFFPDFSVKGSYFNVYMNSTQTGKLGLLKKPLPKEIAIFYTHAGSIVEDLNWMSGVNSSKISKEKALKELLPLKDALNKVLSIGDKIVSQLEKDS